MRKTLTALAIATTCSMVQAKPTQQECAPKPYTMAIKYQQQSAEIQAIQLQTYQLATLRLKEILAQNPNAQNLAIVTDLDETVIDNAALLARDTLACHNFEKWDTWVDWEKEGQPTLIPGSLEFFNFADQNGVKIFYVSDRTQPTKAKTIESLKKLNLPQVQENSVLLLESPKQERREKILNANYNIVMLLGDSLPDFSTDFSSKQSKAERAEAVMRTKEHFGQDWIVLPNASYGSWSKNELEPWEQPLKK